MKIAIIGSAPSSIDLAPYHDPEWQIWGCSPGAAERVKRADVWFEIHRVERSYPWFAPGAPYMRFLEQVPKVYMIEPVPDVPNSVAYPKLAMLKEFYPFSLFFSTSTPAQIAALAIMELCKLPKDEHKEIGFWGVDMAAQEEYSVQRPGCQYFIAEAICRGIKVTLPGQCDLLMPPAMYGFAETDPQWIKSYARACELGARMKKAEEALESTKQELLFLKGAADDLNYHRGTFNHDQDQRRLLNDLMAGKATLES